MIYGYRSSAIECVRTSRSESDRAEYAKHERDEAVIKVVRTEEKERRSDK